MLERIISLIAPHECLVCHDEGSLLCDDCTEATLTVPERCYNCRALSPEGVTCARCHKSSKLHAVQAATEYTAAAKDLVWKLKFGHSRAAVEPMARLIRDRAVFNEDSLLVHVPTATSRVRQRGYDQALLLTRELSRLTGLPSAPLLARQGQSRQVGAARSERLTHLQNAFRVQLPNLTVGKHIVLIDDVLTTGATLETAATVLRAAGAKRVDAIVFAQA